MWFEVTKFVVYLDLVFELRSKTRRRLANNFTSPAARHHLRGRRALDGDAIAAWGQNRGGVVAVFVGLRIAGGVGHLVAYNNAPLGPPRRRGPLLCP